MVEKIEWKKTDVSEAHRENVAALEQARFQFNNAGEKLQDAHQQSLASANLTSPPKTSEHSQEPAKPAAPLKDQPSDKPKQEVFAKTPGLSKKEGSKQVATTGKKIPIGKGIAPQLTNAKNISIANNAQAATESAASVYTEVVTPPPHAELANMLRNNKPAAQNIKDIPENVVIPTKVGIHKPLENPDSGFRWNDKVTDNKSDKGEKNPKGKKSGKSERAAGHGALAKGSSSEGKKLEAASSGITSGGEQEVQWIADEKPIKETFNVESAQHASLEEVMMRHGWFKKYILQNPSGSAEVTQVFAKAIELDQNPELERLLELGLAARLNSYGGMRG